MKLKSETNAGLETCQVWSYETRVHSDLIVQYTPRSEGDIPPISDMETRMILIHSDVSILSPK